MNIRRPLPFRESIIADLEENNMTSKQAQKLVDAIDDSIIESIILMSSKHLSISEYEKVSFLNVLVIACYQNIFLIKETM